MTPEVSFKCRFVPLFLPSIWWGLLITETLRIILLGSWRMFLTNDKDGYAMDGLPVIMQGVAANLET